MSRQEQSLRQLDICEHRFPAGLIVPKGEAGFVLVRWCLRCGDALFDEYQAEPAAEYTQLVSRLYEFQQRLATKIG